jgi:hypothetical protein
MSTENGSATALAAEDPRTLPTADEVAERLRVTKCWGVRRPADRCRHPVVEPSHSHPSSRGGLPESSTQDLAVSTLEFEKLERAGTEPFSAFAEGGDPLADATQVPLRDPAPR